MRYRGHHTRTVKRQTRAIRLCFAGVAVLLTVVLALGAAEIRLHGFDFFTFRAQGVGQTPGTGLQEGQGPGQPDAGGAHGCKLNPAGTCLTGG
jgi:hypothetical protein